MSDEKRKRIEKLAELMEEIPEEKQEGIALGIEMLATFYGTEKKSA